MTSLLETRVAEHDVALNRDEADLLHATVDEIMTTSASELERIARGAFRPVGQASQRLRVLWK